jgi:hypothetical protein
MSKGMTANLSSLMKMAPDTIRWENKNKGSRQSVVKSTDNFNSFVLGQYVTSHIAFPLH